MKATLISLSLTGGQIPKPSHSGECAYDASCRLVRQNEKVGGFGIGTGGWRTLGRMGWLKQQPDQSSVGAGKTFRGSGKTFRCFRETIRGYGKTIRGYGKTIRGFGETIRGSGKTLQGYRETFQGSENTLQGFSETIQGPENTLHGFSETFQGPEKTFHGFRKTIRGSEKTFHGFCKTGRLFRHERRGGGSGALDLAARRLGARFSREGTAVTCRPWEAQALRFWDGLRWPLFGCLFFKRTPPCGQRIRNS